MLKSLIVLPVILLSSWSYAQEINDKATTTSSQTSTLTNPLPKNQFSITGYELMGGNDEFESIGINYERYLGRNNRISLGAGFRWGSGLNNYKNETDYLKKVKSFHFKAFYNPMVGKRFEYSVGLGVIFDRYQQKIIGNGAFRNYKLLFGDEISLVNMHRFKWNINKTFFLGAEGGMGLTRDITGHRMSFQEFEQKVIMLSLQFGVKF